MSNIEQMLDNTAHMAEFVPLNPQEQDILKKITEMSFGRDLPRLVGERYDYR